MLLVPRIRRSSFILVCALPLLLGGSTEEGSPVDRLLQEADVARKAGELDRAVLLLEEAHGLKPMPEILNNLGRLLESMGRYKDAFETYKRVSDDPDADPTLRALDAARAAELRPMVGLGWLQPHLSPEGVELRIDGQVPKRGVGGEIPLEPGPHTLELYDPGTGQIRIKTRGYPLGRRTVLKVNLSEPSAREGHIRWTAKQAPERLVINGHALASPLQGDRTLRLPSGEHQLEITPVGGEPMVARVLLESGDVRRLGGILASAAPRVEPADESPAEEKPEGEAPAEASVVIPAASADTGEVRVVANVEGATGRIGDGAPEPLTHLWTDIPAGTHFVTVEAEGFAPWSRQVLVKGGERTEVVAELKTSGRLHVTADGEKPSEVFLEGKLVGKTPLFLDVETGTYTLLVKRADGAAQEITLAVGKEGTTGAHADFGRARSRVRHRAMPLSAQPIDKGYGSLDLGVGWPDLAMARINTGLNDRLDVGLTFRSSIVVLNEFSLRAKWLMARSRAFAVAVEGEAGFGLAQDQGRSVTAEARLLASILVREKAAVTARVGIGVSSDWAEGSPADSGFHLPVGISVELRLSKFWNLTLLLEGEPASEARAVYEPLHDPLDLLDFDRPHLKGLVGFSLLF